MNNILLEKLLEEYNISQKDSFELKQIFGILTTEKKQKFLTNFSKIAKKIKKIEEEISLEQEILLDKILPDLSEILKN